MFSSCFSTLNFYLFKSQNFGIVIKVIILKKYVLYSQEDEEFKC